MFMIGWDQVNYDPIRSVGRGYQSRVCITRKQQPGRKGAVILATRMLRRSRV